MAWGLNRSSFLGILRGRAEDTVFEKLVSIEQILSDVISKSGQTNFLSERLWLRVNPLIVPLGPNDVGDILKAADRHMDVLTQKVGSRWPSKSLTLGLFIEVPARLNSNLISAIRNWCQELSTRRFGIPEIAIVLHLPNGVNTEDEGLPSIYYELIGINLSLHAEVLVLHREYENTPPPGLSNNELSDLLQRESKSEQGLHFYSWVKAATALWPVGTEEQEMAKYAFVMDAARTVVDKIPSRDSAAWQVVRDLDSLGIIDNYEFNHQFLRLTDRYLPDRIHRLLQAYAVHREIKVRLAALVYASRSDAMMDAWVEGLFSAPQELFGLSELSSRGNVPLIDNYILALLRRYTRGLNRREIMEAIDKLEHVLSPELRETCHLCFGRLAEDTFLKNFKVEKLLFALRSKIELRLTDVDLQRLELTPPGLWWLLSALPIARQRVAEWLRLDDVRRAIIGLCTAAEWLRVRSDHEIERQIMDCRRGRPIKFLKTSD